MLAFVTFVSLLAFGDTATSRVTDVTAVPAGHVSVHRAPVAEIVVLSGPMAWFPTNTGLVQPDRVLWGGSVGAYVPSGVFSVTYARVSDDDSCGLRDGGVGNTGSFNLDSCTGTAAQASVQYRLISLYGRFHPWVGTGAGWYQRRGRGVRTYVGEDFDGFPRSRGDVRRVEEGVTLFASVGGEYTVIERIAVGLDLQFGARAPYFESENGDARQVPEGSGGFVTSTAAVRLAYKIY